MTQATYYDILRIGPRAEPDGVRLAYRKLAQKFHPDKLPGNTDAARVMAMLNEAYAVLSDPKRRALYDSSLDSSAARPLRAPMEVRGAAWPWYLLFATMAFAAVAIGTVLYKSLVPAVAIAAVAPAQPGTQPAILLTSHIGATRR
jgi:hypothetical protein